MLVVIAHIGIGRIPTSYLNSFYMPLFFFLSGCVFSVKRDFKQFLLRKIKSIVIPYFALGIPMLAFTIIKEYMSGDGSIEFIVQLLWQFIVQRRLWTLWYIACLFWLNIVFYIIVKRVNNFKLVGCITLLITVTGFIYYALIGSVLPWNVDAIPFAMLFFFVGFWFKDKCEALFNRLNNHWSSAFAIALALNISFWYLNLKVAGQGLEMFYSQWGIPIFTEISAFGGIAAVVIFSHRYKCSFIRFFGENSLIYFAWHHTIMIPIVRGVFGMMGIAIESIQNKAVLIGEKTLEFIIIMSILTLCSVIVSNTGLKWTVGK